MEKIKLDFWIEKLKAEPDEKKRQAIANEMREAHGLKTGEAWKLLKEAGFDPKAGDNPPPDGAAPPPPPPATEKKITVTLRHKTEYPRYRRAGLALTQTAAPYEVTESQLAALRKDPWVEWFAAVKEDGGK